MSRARAAVAQPTRAVAPESELEPARARSRPERGMAVGFLALLPLLVVYEVSVAAGGGHVRNSAEVFASQALRPFDSAAPLARWICIGACTLLALWFAFRDAHSSNAPHEHGLAARIGRIVLEGLAGALVLGPLLVLLQRALEMPALTSLAPAHGATPRLFEAGLYMGGAAWEEIVFRVGLQSLFYLLASEILRYYGDSRVLARWLGEIIAVGACALVFAAAHLSALTRVFGPGGESFDPAIFAWRFLAGVCLAVLFRWRGPGVAAWTHGWFNLALTLGAGPDVFL